MLSYVPTTSATALWPLHSSLQPTRIRIGSGTVPHSQSEHCFDLSHVVATNHNSDYICQFLAASYNADEIGSVPYNQS